MLKEFEGIIDSQGLCVFRQPSVDATLAEQYRTNDRPHVAFWAVLEMQAAANILQELTLGSRDRALRLLEELSVSLGTQAG